MVNRIKNPVRKYTESARTEFRMVPVSEIIKPKDNVPKTIPTFSHIS